MAGKYRSNGEGTIYKLPNGRWRVQISVRRNGKLVRVQCKLRTRADARAKLDELRGEAKLDLDHEAGRCLLKDFLQEWLRDTVENNVAFNTFRSYKHAVEAHICGTHKGKCSLDLGEIRLERLHAPSVKAWLKEMADAEVGGRTRQNAFVVLRAALEVAVQSNYIIRNPCAIVKKPDHEPEEPKPLELHESLALLKAATGHRHEALYRLGLETGMREGELFGLHWDDFDLKRKKLHITRQATEVWGEIHVGRPKSKRSVRWVRLTDSVVDALVRHRACMLKSGMAACQIVFPNEDGGYFRRGNFTRYSWLPLLAKAEIAARGLHQLRHTAATLMLRAGISIPTVSEILGHSSPKVTMDIYAHVLEAMRADATETMAKLLG